MIYLVYHEVNEGRKRVEVRQLQIFDELFLKNLLAFLLWKKGRRVYDFFHVIILGIL
jgi:hypothetical protein